MTQSELITDANGFSTLRDECNVIFDTNLRLPQQVFRRNFEKYYVFPHGLTLTNDFATILAKLSHDAGDIAVNYMTIAPDPEDYYFKNCGFYGLATFKPESLIDRYDSVMSRAGAADSFRVRGGDISVFWGRTLKWGIFCDRISWELCVMGLSYELDSQIVSAMHCMDVGAIQEYVLREYANKQMIANKFLKEFFVNYPIEKIKHK
jgi:hypothetical protein